MGVDVCLVIPPLSAWNYPSLGLSILKACLDRENISCKVDYASIRYSEMLGQQNLVKLFSIHDFIGEVVFAELAEISPRKSLEEFVHTKASLIEQEADAPIELFRSPIIKKAVTLPKTKSVALKESEVMDLILEARRVAVLWLEKTVEKILAQNPSIVGATSMFQQQNAALAILRRIKKVRPEITTMLGGANCWGRAGGAILRKFSFVDYVFFGEADEIFAEVCRNILSGEKNFSLPYGVLRHGEPVPDELPHRLTSNMDDLPVPNYDDYFESLSTINVPPEIKKITVQLLIEGSRGCWWGEKNPCTFCGLHGKTHKHRFKMPQRILAEIKEYLARYGNYMFTFSDSIMSHIAERDLPELIQTLPTKLQLVSEVKSNLSEEVVQRLSEAGFKGTQPGIESLNDHVLKLMHKGNNAIRHVALLKYARQYGMDLYWNLLHNFPGEQAEDYEAQARLLPLLSHLQPSLSFNTIVFHRNSVYQRNPSIYGLNLEPDESYQFFLPNDDEYLNDYAYCFVNTTPNFDEDLQAAHEKVRKLLRRWYLLCKTYVSMKWSCEQQCYNFEDRLEQRDDGEVLEILDLRECHVECHYELKAVDREIYLLCRSPQLRKKIYKSLEGRYDTETIDRSLELLQEWKILIGIGDEFLALAVDGSN